MYSVRVELYFSAAHNLRGYKGKCEDLHGHNWKVEVNITQEHLDSLGMVVDFTHVKAALKNILEELDHTYLNDHAYFKENNPTSENIARFLYTRLKNEFPGIASVTVWESEKTAATYYET
ncbi:MAG TPA: 6-carboxytetrahydropterin synthase QueD [Candidatus Omnitrophota bacterium]|nr:6-carboxytetrahydropterin synthase QueD [Candidatus Omnitrophota bacterium]HPT07325.1 6-carboxytetrahydropterin synthase QueD [Candidatus Omnitrophota bacterium]